MYIRKVSSKRLSSAFAELVYEPFGQSNLNHKLGSVAGLVSQANARLSFEDDMRSGGLVYCVSQ